MRCFGFILCLLATSVTDAAELTLASPPLRWVAVGGGYSGGPAAQRVSWDMEIAGEVNDRYLYAIRVREMRDIGYFIPCQLNSLSACRRHAGFSDLSFEVGRYARSTNTLRAALAGLGMVIGNKRGASGMEQVITAGLSLEGRFWWTPAEHFAIGVGAFGVLGMGASLTEFYPYLGASLTLGFGRFRPPSIVVAPAEASR